VKRIREKFKRILKQKNSEIYSHISENKFKLFKKQIESLNISQSRGKGKKKI